MPVQLNSPEASHHAPCLADFVVIPFGFKFSGHGGKQRACKALDTYPPQ